MRNENFIKKLEKMTETKFDRFPSSEKRSRKSAMMALSSCRLAVRWYARLVPIQSLKKNFINGTFRKKDFDVFRKISIFTIFIIIYNFD